ncbi:hypothetical protein GW17_00031659 [Ensete ventricosum]|nr:hypothetical protein GW17_00031659 [Ensete ventricosum]
MARPHAKGRSATARASSQGGSACQRPDRRGSRPSMVGCSAMSARGGSRPLPRRRGCCQWYANGRPRPADMGRPTAGSTPVGRQPTGRGIARKGCRLQGRRPWRCRSQGWLPLGRVAAGGQGQPRPA